MPSLHKPGSEDDWHQTHVRKMPHLCEENVPNIVQVPNLLEKEEISILQWRFCSWLSGGTLSSCRRMRASPEELLFSKKEDSNGRLDQGSFRPDLYGLDFGGNFSKCTLEGYKMLENCLQSTNIWWWWPIKLNFIQWTKISNFFENIKFSHVTM